MTTDITTTSPQFTCEIADLKKGLDRIKPALLTRGSGHLPILTQVVVDVFDDHVRVMLTDLDLCLSAPVAATATVPGRFLVSFSTLLKFLTAKKKGSVRFEVGFEQATLTVGTSTLTVATWDPKEFPTPRLPEDPRTVPYNTTAAADVWPSVSHDETRPILCGISVIDGVYAATDSYRLAIVYTNDDTGNPFLIPERTVKVLSKEASGTVEIVVGRRDLSARLADGFELRSRLIEGEFPNYPSLIPATDEVAVEIHDMAAFQAAMKSLVSTTKALGSNDVDPVRFIDAETHGVVAVNVTGAGDTTEQFPGRVLIPGAFNPKYLLEAVTGTSFTEIRGVDLLKPFMMREPLPEAGEGAERARLLMPVRVS